MSDGSLSRPDLLAVDRNSVTLPIAPCFHIGGVENESDLFGIRIDPGLSKGKFQAVANIVGVLEKSRVVSKLLSSGDQENIGHCPCSLRREPNSQVACEAMAMRSCVASSIVMI